MQIDLMLQELETADETFANQKTENEKLEDSLFFYIEQQEYLLGQIEKIRIINNDAISRAALSEVKLYNSDVTKEFGECSQEILDFAEGDSNPLMSTAEFGKQPLRSRLSTFRSNQGASVVDERLKRALSIRMVKNIEKTVQIEEDLKERQSQILQQAPNSGLVT